MLKLTLRVILLAVFSASSFSVVAQSKHPRVAELEDKMKDEATSFLKARFPSLPFSVQVNIEALRRSAGDSYTPKGETLPYYSLEEEEILDEWDDPSASLYSLRARVKRIFVQVEIPSNVSEVEMGEIREALTETLRLLPARDQVEIRKKQWKIAPQTEAYLYYTSAAIMAFLIGLFVIIKLATYSIAKQMKHAEKSASSAPAPAISAMPAMGREVGASRQSSSHDNGGGNIQFTDPVKVRELIGVRIQELVENKTYLNLENLREFDDMAKQSPSSLGALLTLFPVEVQNQWLSFSNGAHWLEAFHRPGALNVKAIEVIEDMCRVQSDRFDQDWENLRIQLWRMGDNATNFLQKLDKEEAFALLNALPKSIAVPVARNAFPGSWASIIETDAKFKKISNQRLQEIFSLSKELKPLVQHSDLISYKKDKELIEYLKLARVSEERDIYEAIRGDERIETLRPPFYKVLSADQEALKYLFSQYNVSNWAMVLMDVSRDWRSHIEKEFNEKEKYLYYENLKRFDQEKPSKEEVGELREHIARTYKEYEIINSLNLMDGDSGATSEAAAEGSSHEEAA